MVIKKLFKILWDDNRITPGRVIERSLLHYRQQGFRGMQDRLTTKFNRLYPSTHKTADNHKLYEKWIEQNEQDSLIVEPLDYMPLVSIITPTYNTEKKYLIEMFDSVFAQTYTNWELCLADDASANDKTIGILKGYEKKHKNIKVVYRKTNGHISEASNSALVLATGKYVVFLDHDDTLSPNALYEMVKKLNENRELKLIYSDEDKIDKNGKRYNPHFKSGWNPDMFFSHNYICHLVFLAKELVDNIEGFRSGYDGSQDYDLLLRCIDRIKQSEIARVEKILYHWRAIEGSTAYGSGEKEYTNEAGLRALQDYFSNKRKGITVENGLLPNTYKANYPLPKKAPLVSILIPTRDGYELLSKCIESIVTKTVYPNYEIIILDNETTCPKTRAYFKKVSDEYGATVWEYHKAFNYSAINNYGVSKANGEIIALVNNDIEVINKGWLTEMVQHAIRPEIGAVGAKLYYDDGSIQHAGVVLGIGGVAGHSHKYFRKDADGYFSRLKVTQNYSAVTGACMVIRKKIFQEVGGFDEENLAVAFNDVDFCLKIQERGYRNLWSPYAELYHHESKSRGAEDTDEKRERFAKEMLYMKTKWKDVLLIDRYYNGNLTDKHENFATRD